MKSDGLVGGQSRIGVKARSTQQGKVLEKKRYGRPNNRGLSHVIISHKKINNGNHVDSIDGRICVLPILCFRNYRNHERRRF